MVDTVGQIIALVLKNKFGFQDVLLSLFFKT